MTYCTDYFSLIKYIIVYNKDISRSSNILKPHIFREYKKKKFQFQSKVTHNEGSRGDVAHYVFVLATVNS